MGLTCVFTFISLIFTFLSIQSAILAPQIQALFEPGLLIPVNTTTLTPTVLSNDSNVALFCNSTSTWLTPGSTFDTTYSDCVHAVMDVEDVAEIYGNLHFEFLAAGQEPTRRIDIMRTPRRYTFGSCTALIVNLANFPPAYLPEHARRPYPPTDTASYYDLHDNLDLVLQSCMRTPWRTKQLGWAEAGDGSGLGVFLVGTNSDLDQRVRASAELEVELEERGENWMGS